MNILLINAHPDYQNASRSTNQLAAFAEAQIAKLAPTATLDRLDLYAESAADLPRLSAASLNDVDALAAAQDAIIARWRRADFVMIMMPLHNFNVVSRLKDYIDNLLIANKTFRYTVDGSVGLLDPNQRVLYLQTSGSDYSRDLRYVNADIAPHYLRTILNFMGIGKMDLIRAQGLDLLENDKAAIIDRTKVELGQYLDQVLA